MKKEENHSTSISLQSKCSCETLWCTNDYLLFCVAYGGHGKTMHKRCIYHSVCYNDMMDVLKLLCGKSSTFTAT